MAIGLDKQCPLIDQVNTCYVAAVNEGNSLRGAPSLDNSQQKHCKALKSSYETMDLRQAQRSLWSKLKYFSP